MTKYLIKKYIKNFLFLIIGLVFLLVVKSYSQSIALFNNYDILIQGNKFVSKDEIKRSINNNLLQNYFSINLKKLKVNINSLDYIEFSQISLIFPNKIIINIVEREPVALITLNDKNYFIDKSSALLPTKENSINYFPVPIINVNQDLYYDNETLVNIGNVFKLILEDYPLFYKKLSEIIIYEKKWIFFSDTKTKIFTSPKNIILQLYTLKAFESTVFPVRKLGDYSYIDLRIPEQIIVKEKYIKG